MRRLGALIVAAVVLVASVSAYVISGAAWASSSVAFRINPTNKFGISSTDIEAALQRGSAPWGTTGAPIALAFAGETTSCGFANDGRNNVCFRDDTNGGFIAETYWYSDGTGHLIDFDMVFHEGLVAMFADPALCSGGINIQETALHEFGHAIGLNHSADASAIMYPDVGYCDPRTMLTADDINGVKAAYPGTAPSPSPGPLPTPSPTPTPAPSGPTLTLKAYKVKGFQTVDLKWSGLSGGTVDMTRNGAAIRSNVANDGSETDSLGKRGGGSYVYRVCASGTAICTNDATATF